MRKDYRTNLFRGRAIPSRDVPLHDKAQPSARKHNLVRAVLAPVMSSRCRRFLRYLLLRRPSLYWRIVSVIECNFRVHFLEDVVAALTIQRRKRD